MRIEDYVRMSFHERLVFLESHVPDDKATDLSGGFLLKALAQETRPEFQWFLVKAVGTLGLPAAIPDLIRLCKRPDTEMPGHAVAEGRRSLHLICAWSFGRIGRIAYDPVLELLNDANLGTRRCGVDALGEIGDARAVPLLCRYLDRGEHSLQLWAGLSLAKIGRAALPQLRRLRKSSDEFVHLLSSDAIDKIERENFIYR